MKGICPAVLIKTSTAMVQDLLIRRNNRTRDAYARLQIPLMTAASQMSACKSSIRNPGGVLNCTHHVLTLG